MGSSTPPQSEARSPGLISTWSERRQKGQWLRHEPFVRGGTSRPQWTQTKPVFLPWTVKRRTPQAYAEFPSRFVNRNSSEKVQPDKISYHPFMHKTVRVLCELEKLRSQIEQGLVLHNVESSVEADYCLLVDAPRGWAQGQIPTLNMKSTLILSDNPCPVL